VAARRRTRPRSAATTSSPAASASASPLSSASPRSSARTTSDFSTPLQRLRQSELLGLRWRDVDWVAQRSVCATPTCAVSTRTMASPTSLPSDPCRWPTDWPASLTAGQSAPPTAPICISCSLTHRPATDRPIEGHQALPDGLRGRRRAGHQVPRSAPHLDPARRRRTAAAADPGVHGARRQRDDPDLLALPSLSARGPGRQRRLRPRPAWRARRRSSSGRSARSSGDGRVPETTVEVEAPDGPTDATGNNPGNKLSESESN
jgi:hypothetical protein